MTLRLRDYEIDKLINSQLSAWLTERRIERVRVSSELHFTTDQTEIQARRIVDGFQLVDSRLINNDLLSTVDLITIFKIVLEGIAAHFDSIEANGEQQMMDDVESNI